MCSERTYGSGVCQTWPLLCSLLWTVASASGTNGHVIRTIGFLIENPDDQFQEWDVGPDPSAQVTGKAVSFPVGRHSSLIKAAKTVNDTGVDLVIGYVSYHSVHQLHRLFGKDKGEWRIGNGSSSIGDMVWFVALQNQPPLPGCLGYRDVVLPSDSVTGQRTAEALVVIIRQLQWKHLTLLYHPKYEQISTTTINLLSDVGVKIYQYRVNDETALRFAINKSADISTAETMNYVLFADQSFTYTVLESLQWYVKESGGSSSITAFSPWILWGEDLVLTRTAENLGQLNNVAILQGVPCKGVSYSSMSMQLMPYRILNDTVAATKITELNSSCSDLPAAEQYVSKLFLAAQETLSCDDCLFGPAFKIYTAFWKSFGRRFECVVDTVTKSKLNVSHVMIFPNTQFGLNNKSLVITTLPWPPYVYKTDVNGKAEYYGFCIDLIKELSHNLNFSYTIIEPDDQEWGRILNGKWTGLVGQMHRREADLTVAALSVQPEREEVMDFISPYYTEYTVIILKKPAESSTKWRTLIDPFSWVVLVAIAVSLPVVTFFLTLCEKLSPCYAHIQNRGKYPGLHNFSDCFWYLLGALLTQGGVYLPKSQSSRTITSFWWLFSIIVVATYSGNLIASLTVTRSLIPFNSVKEMVQQSTYKWGTANGTYLNMLLQMSKDPIYRQIWAGIKRFEKEDPDVLHPNHSVQVARVKAGEYAYLNDASSMNTEILTDCSLALVDEEFLPLHFAVGLRQNSPYRSIFDEQMVAISESGLLSIWKRKWWMRNSTCLGLLIRQAKPISLLDVQSAYYLLLLGITVAGFMTLAEKARKFLGNREI